ncbi:deoxyribose-phosphate aldolase [Ruminococcaceae bacterium OttesenSCG-928-A16]|nr:deoxyribose-phosphate aldolase [Ruminococcaceae bacterium OttesenSCG-928-A16]
MSELLQQMTPEKLAQYFDHTCLNANAVQANFEKLCAESRQYGFKMVAINPAPVKLCKKLLAGSGVLVGAAVGFPLGQNTKAVKVAETIDAIQEGADEIDYVINIGQLKDKNYTYIEEEMQEIVQVCRQHGRTSKVIFENCYLTDDEKRELCRIALRVKPDFIKTSTGFGPSGAMLQDVQLMKDMVGDAIKIKAAGGIRNLETALALIQIGVQRIGSTSSVAIVQELMNSL